MRNFARFALIMGAFALFAACGGIQTPIGPPSAIPQAPVVGARTARSNYKVVYSFAGAPDGRAPVASLIDVGGTLYGTTSGGGAHQPCGGTRLGGCGVVFSLTPNGAEKVLYSFQPKNDGNVPHAGLIDVGGMLYGTTQSGGSYLCYPGSGYFPCGTVFSITTAGTEKVLHSFRPKTDGFEPEASLIKVRDTLYGTTYEGGTNRRCKSYGRCGTVFSITPSGTERVLHNFVSSEGQWPAAGLVEAGHTLYGTTSYGGGTQYAGTVFSITRHGRLKVLHVFSGSPDGALPLAGLIEVKGIFYGTTSGGGTNGDGTVFSITPNGEEQVLHSFGSGTDGKGPAAALIDVKGMLYGTTSAGGANGYGTVFRITTSGTEKVLHSFGDRRSDGRGPQASLIDVAGTLYGTTAEGGAAGCGYGGCGTVFALTP